VARAAQRADQRDLARGAGVAHPVGFAAGGDQIAPPLEFERIDRQRDRPAARSAGHLENVEMATDEADPDEAHQGAAKAAFDGARPRIACRIFRHPGCPSLAPAATIWSARARAKRLLPTR
jgi:hypothetical protein